MKQYSIEIPNPGIGTYRLITNLLLAINFLAFGALYLGNGSGKLLIIVSLIGIALNAGALGISLFKGSLFKSIRFGIGPVFFINAMLWAVSGKLFLSFLMLVFAGVGIYANRALIIIFNQEGIFYPSFPSKLIPWNEVEQVICKDGILSIDLKNNKLLQFDISPDEATNLSEIDFNTFCDRLCLR